jgi:hypothetical protein
MKRWVSASAALLFIGALALSGCESEPGEIIVDPTRTYQTMKGWEATARLWETNKEEDRYDQSWLSFRNHIFDRLVNELGINRVRLEIKSGAENPVDYWTKFETGEIGYKAYRRYYYEKINDNDVPDRINPAGIQFSALDYQVEAIVLPLKRRIEANGERLFVNLNYVDFGQTEEKGTLSHALNPEEYAELIHAAFVHLKEKYSLVPDALEIILEPDHTDHWRGKEIGEAVVAVVRRLTAAGFSPQIIAPSTAAAQAAPSYFDELTSVPGAGPLISTLSYHRYGWGASKALPEILKRAQKFGISTAMLEHLTGDGQELHDDLTRANVSAWQQYAIATRSVAGRSDKNGYYYILDLKNPAAPVLRMAARTRILAQYFRYIRFGAQRIEAHADRSELKPVAFRNTDGTYVVVVQVESAGTFRVRGVPPGRYYVRYTTNQETGRELPPLMADGKAISAQLPAPGTVTFYQKALSVHDSHE